MPRGGCNAANSTQEVLFFGFNKYFEAVGARDYQPRAYKAFACLRTLLQYNSGAKQLSEAWGASQWNGKWYLRFASLLDIGARCPGL